MSSIFVLPSKEPSEVLCKKFNTWLRTSVKGEKFCYFVGKFISDGALRRMVYKSYEQGYIELVQKKVADNFEYWAIRKDKMRW